MLGPNVPMYFCKDDEGTDDAGSIRVDDLGGCYTTESALGVDSFSRCGSGRAGMVFQALPSSTVVSVSDLTICMEIDLSPRFTRLRDVLSNSCFESVSIGGSMSSSLSTSLITCFIFFATAPTLYHCLLQKKLFLSQRSLRSILKQILQIRSPTAVFFNR